MTSPCIEDRPACTAKSSVPCPAVGNGVLRRESGAESQLPRMSGEANTDGVDRPHVKSPGVRFWVISEGYRYVTWYCLLLFVLVSLAMVEPVAAFLKDIYSAVFGPSSTPWLSGAVSILEAIMYRIKLGWLPVLAVSTCIVTGNDTMMVGTEMVVNRTFEVFDYVDPLIGTINGGEMCTFKGQASAADDMYRSRFSWCNTSLRCASLPDVRETTLK